MSPAALPVFLLFGGRFASPLTGIAAIFLKCRTRLPPGLLALSRYGSRHLEAFWHHPCSGPAGLCRLQRLSRFRFGATRARSRAIKRSAKSQAFADLKIGARNLRSRRSATRKQYCPSSSAVARQFGMRYRHQMPPISRCKRLSCGVRHFASGTSTRCCGAGSVAQATQPACVHELGEV
jgi:hypothetical protein